MISILQCDARTRGTVLGIDFLPVALAIVFGSNRFGNRDIMRSYLASLSFPKRWRLWCTTAFSPPDSVCCSLLLFLFFPHGLSVHAPLCSASHTLPSSVLETATATFPFSHFFSCLRSFIKILLLKQMWQLKLSDLKLPAMLQLKVPPRPHLSPPGGRGGFLLLWKLHTDLLRLWTCRSSGWSDTVRVLSNPLPPADSA